MKIIHFANFSQEYLIPILKRLLYPTYLIFRFFFTIQQTSEFPITFVTTKINDIVVTAAEVDSDMVERSY